MQPLGSKISYTHSHDDGVAESLIANKGFDGEHMMWTFIRNWKREPWRGYDPGPPRVFRMILKGGLKICTA